MLQSVLLENCYTPFIFKKPLAEENHGWPDRLKAKETLNHLSKAQQSCVKLSLCVKCSKC